MNSNRDLQVGDIGLYHGHNLVARGIQYFMCKYCNKYYKDSPPMIYNHAFIILEDEHKIKRIADMNYKWTIRSVHDYNDIQWTNDILILRPKVPYTHGEQNAMNILGKDYKILTKYYQLVSWVQLAVYITFGVYIGFKGWISHVRLFCSEAVGLITNWARKGTFKDTYKLMPMDIYYNDKFNKIKL